MVAVSGGVNSESVARCSVVFTAGLSEHPIYWVPVSISNMNDIDLLLLSFNLMLKKILLLVAILYVNITNAQVTPAEDAMLNYRMIGFSVPVQKAAKTYTFEVSATPAADVNVFEKGIMLKKESAENRTVLTVPDFDRKYGWRVTYKDKTGKVLNRSKIYMFATGTCDYLNAERYKLDIYDRSEEHKDLLVILDHSSIMYNMNGEAVWFLPEVPGVFQRDKRTRDLKPTADGTFTVLNDFGAFEFDYDGNVLWKAPDNGKISGDTFERYHHEFTKLSNGHYLVAGYEKIYLPIPPDKFDYTKIQIDETVKKDGGKLLKRIDCGTIIEYDKDGNIVWSWKSSMYFKEEDFFSNAFPDGTPNTNTHLNAVYFDETRNCLYASFRDISTILKIKYPSGEVVRSYGKPIARQRDGMERVPFRAQHSCRISKDGLLYLFNNNTARTRDVVSNISFYEEPETTGGSLKKVWEYKCDMDTFAAPGSASGGSVYMLADSTVLGCMGIEGRVFLVKYDKTLLWNAVPRYKNDLGIWEVLPQYRASMIEHDTDITKYIFKKQIITKSKNKNSR